MGDVDAGQNFKFMLVPFVDFGSANNDIAKLSSDLGIPMVLDSGFHGTRRLLSCRLWC